MDLSILSDEPFQRTNNGCVSFDIQPLFLSCFLQKRTHYRTTVFERRSSGMSDKSLLPYVQTKVVWSDMELVTTRRLQIWRAPRTLHLKIYTKLGFRLVKTEPCRGGKVTNYLMIYTADRNRM